jgi:F-type H+-transporting ATPase subunit a
MAPIKPELITHIGGFPVTNTFIGTLLIDAILIIIIFFVARNVKIIPSGIQSLFESMLEYLFTLSEEIAGDRNSAIFPWFASFFIFILFSNFMGLLPGLGSFGLWENVEGHKVIIPLFRSASSDFNMTVALGTISLIATHVLALKFNGFIGYLGKYLSINPINLFVGLLEFVLEPVKVLSLSFRLFGNIYSGEVVLATVSGLFAYLAPIPFLMLESIVAIVQALVFAMLTLAFMSILTNKNEGGGH